MTDDNGIVFSKAPIGSVVEAFAKLNGLTAACETVEWMGEEILEARKCLSKANAEICEAFGILSDLYQNGYMHSFDALVARARDEIVFRRVIVDQRGEVEDLKIEVRELEEYTVILEKKVEALEAEKDALERALGRGVKL